jgi:hypothetical protein
MFALFSQDMVKARQYLTCGAGIVMLAACGRPATLRPVFVDGRAVHTAGDSVLGLTREGMPSLLVVHVQSGTADTLGTDILHSPFHVQALDGLWYVSDVDDGRPSIVVLAADGELVRRIDLDGITAARHQFAVLPDGRIVVEAPDRRLIALAGDSSTTFALTEGAMRTGFLVAAGGGVLHAIPDHTIALYNAFGNIRWRVEWPWAETAFVSDLSVDGQGRPHVIAGIPNEGDGVFIVFSLARDFGEVDRWSAQGSFATFVVNWLGEVRPDSTSEWIPQ